MINEATVSRRGFLGSLGVAGACAAAAGMFGCAGQSGQSTSSSSSSASATSSGSIAIDSSAWNYDSDNDVYYQIGLQYCENPQAPTYETMGIYVPGAYFDATENSNKTFTCTPSETGKIAGYTASTAPIVMPINTAGYSAQSAPTSYSSKSLSSYLKAGFVYVHAGCRGRKMEDDACGAAPWGVTDLKAAVRTLRYNDNVLPGDKDRIFSFGHSGGGAQSAVLGATGDAKGYDDYLAAIGAPMTDVKGKTLSDAIYGAMCWCPITCLIGADMAYEWNMGQFENRGTRAEGTFTRQLSQDLAVEYRDYINALGLVDSTGTALTLEDGGEGIACAGSYYDYVKSQVEISLNNFLADTTFPYTPSSGGGGMPSGGGPSGGDSSSGAPSGGAPSGGAPSGEMPSGAAPSGEAPSGGAPSGEMPSGEAPSGGVPSGSSASASSSSASANSGSSAQGSTSYATAEDYIASLNGDNAWINYDSATGVATITGLAGFVANCKSASKGVGAFDELDLSGAENEVFGSESNEAMHYNAAMATLLANNADTYAALSGWDANYPSAYKKDRDYVDAQGKTSDFRQELYDPMSYLSDAYENAGSSTPAPHWRIRTGITQGDTASTVEINLALALAADKRVSDVDFATVWAQGHTTAERTGSNTDNFITWINDCCK